MCNVSSRTRPNGNGETSWEAGDIADFERESQLICNANSVPITLIFEHYNLHLDENNRKIICPFPNHKSGRENTASFLYYPQTNTFWCFGCKIGPNGCDFVASMDNIIKIKAANKILNIFSGNIINEENNKQDFSERMEIMIDFSNIIRNFHQNNLNEESFKFIEMICNIYDEMNYKYKLTNEALLSLINKLKLKILGRD
mgnify:CR=1 FL=1